MAASVHWRAVGRCGLGPTTTQLMRAVGRPPPTWKYGIDMTKKRATRLILAIYAILLVIAGFYWFQSARDAVVSDASGRHLTFSLPLYSAWQQCRDSAILFSPGNWEWTAVDPHAEILNWENRKTMPLPLPHPNALKTYSFSQSPDCSTVVVAEGSDLYAIDESGAADYLGMGELPTYSPLGNRIAFVREDTLFVRSMSDDQETRVGHVRDWFAVEGMHIDDIAWGADESFFVVRATSLKMGAITSKLALLPISNATTVGTPLEIASGWLSKPAVSPDGRLIAYLRNTALSKPSMLVLYGLTLRCAIATAEVSRGDQVIWSPDGERLLLHAGIQAEAELVLVADIKVPSAPDRCID